MGDGEPEWLEPTVEVAERLARLGERSVVWPEVCRRAGGEHELADRLWRALGFPDVPEDEPAHSEEDVQALRIAGEGFDGLTGADRARAVKLLVGEARLVSAHLTSIAETEVDAIAGLGRPRCATFLPLAPASPSDRCPRAAATTSGLPRTSQVG